MYAHEASSLYSSKHIVPRMRKVCMPVACLDCAFCSARGDRKGVECALCNVCKVILAILDLRLHCAFFHVHDRPLGLQHIARLARCHVYEGTTDS